MILAFVGVREFFELASKRGNVLLCNKFCPITYTLRRRFTVHCSAGVNDEGVQLIFKGL
jgi:hypothetical protein